MLKVVADTSTIISGLLWKGNESKLLQEAEEENIRLFISKEILEEIEQVINYDQLQKYIAESELTKEQLLEKVNSLCHIVFGEKLNIDICRDKRDNKIIECAVHAKADFIVSGDKDILSLKEYEKIKIISTNEILKILK